MSQEKETNQEMTEEKMTENTEETVKDSEASMMKSHGLMISSALSEARKV